ncbi:hypothetical protein N7456_011299 [Penicillium angulare]|uniref:Uncharacterized protein n=1 Tax=Penicillium angulare TaxID=116970 RepID=A0A9W9ETH3_9EURO|nr:hypothetical protein N7456_011299 [Penicillium angulare]
MQKSKILSDPLDKPPQYKPCQPTPTQDLLAAVIENERTRRKLMKKATKLFSQARKLRIEIDNYQKPGILYPALGLKRALELDKFLKEAGKATTELVNYYQERKLHNTDLYLAMSMLTDDEFERTCSSLQRLNGTLGHGVQFPHGAGGQKTTFNSLKTTVRDFWKKVF